MDLTEYLAIRDRIRTGDVLAVGGRGLISKAIKWWTRSAISHVGMFVEDHRYGRRRLTVVQALAKYGVVELPASRYLSELDGEAWWIQLDHPKFLELNPHYQDVLGDFMLHQRGRKYDTGGALKHFAPWLKNAQQNYYCSEVMDEAYCRTAYVESLDITPCARSPQQLVEMPYLRQPWYYLG